MKKESSHVDFCSFDLTFQCRFFTFSFLLFSSFSLFVLKRVRHSLQSNSYVKSFHIGIHLIRSAEGTYLH